MSTVSEIVDIIAAVSLNEDDPDSDTQTRMVRYINRAYFDIYRRVAQYLDNTEHTTQNVSVTSGSGTLSPVPLKILSVVDTTDERVLTKRSVYDIELDDPNLDSTGDAVHYYVSGGSTLKLWPIDTKTVRVRYIPKPASLSITSLGDDIKLPAEFHDVLEFGAMYYMYMDERDVRTSFEITETKREFRQRLSQLTQYLSSNAQTQRTVQGHYF